MNLPDDLPEDVEKRLREINEWITQLGKDIREGFCCMTEAAANAATLLRAMKYRPPELKLEIPLYDCEGCGGRGKVVCHACCSSKHWQSCARCGGHREVDCTACAAYRL